MKKIFALLLVIVLAVSTLMYPSWAGAQNWFQASPPSGRCCMGIAFDVPTHSTLIGTLLFGGFDFAQVYGDTWILREGGWFQLHPVSSPPPRGGPGMAYDCEFVFC